MNAYISNQYNSCHCGASIEYNDIWLHCLYNFNCFEQNWAYPEKRRVVDHALFNMRIGLQLPRSQEPLLTWQITTGEAIRTSR